MIGDQGIEPVDACRYKPSKGSVMTDSAQIYLQTPEQFEPSDFAPVLAEILATTSIACVRISMASGDAAILGRAADVLREVCHAREVAIVIDDHYRMVETHGLDGVHLTDGSRSVRAARDALGKDAIVGAYCGDSRHNGITAAEIGVDYVSFGPLADSGAVGDGSIAPAELFEWWSEMIEVPVVAEGIINADTISKIKDTADFVCLGADIWQTDDPQATIKEIIGLLA